MIFNIFRILKGLSSEINGGSKVISIDSAPFGQWSRRYSFARNTAAILKFTKNILAQYNTRMYNCWVTFKAP
jgi:hypothetical protein